MGKLDILMQKKNAFARKARQSFQNPNARVYDICLRDRVSVDVSANPTQLSWFAAASSDVQLRSQEPFSMVKKQAIPDELIVGIHTVRLVAYTGTLTAAVADALEELAGETVIAQGNTPDAVLSTSSILYASTNGVQITTSGAAHFSPNELTGKGHMLSNLIVIGRQQQLRTCESNLVSAFSGSVDFEVAIEMDAFCCDVRS